MIKKLKFQLDDIRSKVKEYLQKKPVKEDEFKNWIRKTFNVTEKHEVKKLWKTHKYLQKI